MLSEKIKNYIKKNFFLLIVLFNFFVVSFFIVIFGDPSCIAIEGECALDSDRYSYRLAETLFSYGQFSSFPNMGPYVEHPPLHALILAGTFFLVGYKTYIPILIIHLFLNVLTGLFVRSICNTIIGRFGMIAMCLYLFNPNVLAHANLIGSNSLPAFFISGAILSLLYYLRGRSLRSLLICGLLLGLGTLIRPIVQPLIFVLPIAIIVLNMISYGFSSWLLSLKHALISFGVAIVVISPWAIYMNSHDYGYSISNPKHFRLLLVDSLTLLTSSGPWERNKKVKMDRYEIEEKKLSSTIPKWNELSEGKKERLRAKETLNYYLEFPFDKFNFFRALAVSWGRFIFSSGSGYINTRLGISEDINSRGTAFNAVYYLSHLYTIITQIFGLVGLIFLIRQQMYSQFLLIVSPIFFIMVTTLMVGLPRYRASVEPEFAVLAAIGLCIFFNLFRSKPLIKTESKLE